MSQCLPVLLLLALVCLVRSGSAQPVDGQAELKAAQPVDGQAELKAAQAVLEELQAERRGSSTSSVLNGRDSTPLMTTVDNCGAYPVVPNSIAFKESDYILKYQCNNYYKHDGPETVTCHSDGSWSELPVCKEAFCTLNTGRYVRSYVKLSAVEYIPEGETKQFPCIGYHYHTSIARCTSGRITLSYCCTWDDRTYGRCGVFTAEHLTYN